MPRKHIPSRPEGIKGDAVARYLYLLGANLDPGEDIPHPREGRLREFITKVIDPAEDWIPHETAEEVLYQYLRMGQRERGSRILSKPPEVSRAGLTLW